MYRRLLLSARDGAANGCALACPSGTTAQRFAFKDSNGIVVVYKDNGDKVLLDDTYQGILGYWLGNGYYGSSIYVSLYWNAFLDIESRNRIKEHILKDFVIERDMPDEYVFNAVELRHVLDDMGIGYRPSTLRGYSILEYTPKGLYRCRCSHAGRRVMQVKRIGP